MLIILSLYGIAVWLIFFKLRWLEMTKRAGSNVVVIGVLFLAVVYVGLGRRTPASVDAMVQASVIQIGARVEGRVEQVFVHNDQRVSAGDPLFSLEKRPYEIAHDLARADLIGAEEEAYRQYATLSSARHLVTRLEADLELQKKDLDRIQALAASDVASQRNLDRQITRTRSVEEDLSRARFELRKAEVAIFPELVLNEVLSEVRGQAARLKGLASTGELDDDQRYDYEQAKLSLERAEAFVAAASVAAEEKGTDLAGVLQARARLDDALYDLDETTVYAPLDGWITGLQLAPGKNLLMSRFEVMSLVAAEPWWINASFVERGLERIRSGDACEFALKSYPGRVFDCRIESVGQGVVEGQGMPSGDLPDAAPSGSGSQEFPVWARVADERLDGALRVGAKAAVTVYSGDGANFGLNVLAKILLRLRSLLFYFS